MTTDAPRFQDRIREFRRVPAKELHPNPKNWRRHPKAQTSALLGVFAEIGYADVVIAYNAYADREPGDEYLVLIDGHARLELAKPDELIPTIILDVTEEEADKLLITLDPLTMMADVDRGRLAELVNAANFQDSRTSALLERIRRDNRLPAARPAVEPVVAPEPAQEPIARLGDLWRLGDHRVLVGDATELNNLERLMAGDGASVVFTDPPYGVSYQADGHAPIAGDDKRQRELLEFLRQAFFNAKAMTLPQAAWYVWHASSTRREFERALDAAGVEEIEYLIWVKPTLVLGHADYQWQHEPCFYAARAGERPPFFGPRSESTVWRISHGVAAQDRAISLGNGILLTTGTGELLVTPAGGRGKTALHIPLDDGETIYIGADDAPDSNVWQVSRDTLHPDHPTQKPAALAARALVNSSLRGQIVLDPFLGSGSTLIGAELTGRRCFGMELEPRYVDGIVRKWESMTGRKAQLDRLEENPA